MLKHICWLILIPLIFTSSASASAPADNSVWQVVAPGIEYRQIKLPDPNNVFAVRMERSNPTVTLESSIAKGKVAQGKETVSDMAARYDQALNYWGGSANPPTWGMRNQVVAAINGSYFDYASGIPWGGQVQSGWYAKRYDDLGGWSGFGWTLGRIPFIGECVYHKPQKQTITYPATGNQQLIADINDPRGEDELVIFTPQYNSQTGTTDSGVEVVVEMNRPTLILPDPAFASGIVRQINNNKGNSLIPFNSIVLSASGSAAQELLQNVQVGSEVRVTQEITSLEKDCKTPYPSISWTKTYAGIQGAYFFLKNGQILNYTDSGAVKRNPRTAIAYDDQYIYFIVVDGRDNVHSIGMTIDELALFSRDTLGASWGVAQDGGGSSTLVINGQVVNNTYCNMSYCVSRYTTFLPIIAQSSVKGQTFIAPEGDQTSSPTILQRPVANGMLMVIAQPAQYSTAFSPGDGVTATADTGMRLGPGTNYDSFSLIPKGAHGTILEQMNNLNGVQAKGSYWWYVDFGGVSGWIPQGSLTRP